MWGIAAKEGTPGGTLGYAGGRHVCRFIGIRDRLRGIRGIVLGIEERKGSDQRGTFFIWPLKTNEEVALRKCSIWRPNCQGCAVKGNLTCSGTTRHNTAQLTHERLLDQVLKMYGNPYNQNIKAAASPPPLHHQGILTHHSFFKDILTLSPRSSHSSSPLTSTIPSQQTVQCL